MPITLVTGLPGHGKTLYSVAALAERAKTENRCLYVHGIPDLAIDHEPLDDPNDWHKLPDGALICIDECQRVFPKRPNGSKVPEHVSQLETHRHKGFDLHLITQHPSLIDNHVRQLVDQHYHVKRQFGLHKALVYNWPECRDPKSKTDLKQAIQTIWSYPTNVFKLYRSATVHTVKRKIPLKIILGVLGIPLAVVVAYLVIQALRSGSIGPGANFKDQAEASSPAASVVMAQGDQLLSSNNQGPKQYNPKDWNPRIDGLPHTAKAYDAITAEPSDVPLPQACVNMHNVCKCFTDQGTAIDNMSKEMCLNIVERGYFNPYKTKLQPPQQPPALQEKVG